MVFPFAQTGATPTGTEQIVYSAARVASWSGWWWWASTILVVAALIGLSIYYYRRDVVELTFPIRVMLISCRLVVITALIFFFLDITRRTEQLINKPSEVAILVDTSQSMSLPEKESVDAKTRAERAISLLDQAELPETVANEHVVSLYQFGNDPTPGLVRTYNQQSTNDVESNKLENESNGVSPSGDSTSIVAVLGGLLIVAGLIFAFFSLVLGGTGRAATASPLILAMSWVLPLGIIVLGTAWATKSNRTFMGLFDSSQIAVQSDSISPDDVVDEDKVEKQVDLATSFAPEATGSKIGDSINDLLSRHDPSTLAGIVLISDGQNNGGDSLLTAANSARRAEVAVHSIGMGNPTAPTNVRLVDLDVPRRVYPGDKFVASAVFQATGKKPLSVEIQLWDELANEATDNDTLPKNLIETKTVELPNDGTLTTVPFELETSQVGRRRLAIIARPPELDQNKDDNLREARYEVVSERLKVLAIAGGPTREYRFVRNLLYRDESVQLDVHLQTGQEGLSQDADNLLSVIPNSADQLFEYDAIIMFDPDWTSIDAGTLELIDRYLARQSGGMILIAGPVYHPVWLRNRTDPRVARIAGFFPVNVGSGSSVSSIGRQGGQSAWPLDLTPEAARADFMMIDGDPASSLSVWNEFSGVYDFVAVRDPKPGAKVYAYFSDPTTEISGAQPVFLASQFYGGGRTFFCASGEMWRLHGIGDGYFERYYTKLVRWVSEGRLQRDSNRGLLLVDNPRAMIGDTITVRAVLTNEQFEPLDVPSIDVQVLPPKGANAENLTLRPIESNSQPGTYSGRFTVRTAGSYEIRLTLGDALNEQVLRKNVDVRLPTIELERPQRNDADLKTLANVTGGKFFPVDENLSDENLLQQVTETLTPQPQVLVLPGVLDIEFLRRRNATLLWLIATVITMEWVVRRLHRLA